MKTSTRERIVAAFSSRPNAILTPSEIAEMTGCVRAVIGNHLSFMVKDGVIKQAGRGKYRYPAKAPNGAPAPTPAISAFEQMSEQMTEADPAAERRHFKSIRARMADSNLFAKGDIDLLISIVPARYVGETTKDERFKLPANGRAAR